MKKINYFVAAFLLSANLSSCGGTSSSGSDDACASGDNDFYIVENASCADGEGKLSRINPDTTCKEEILTALNCPVDFVLSTVDGGIGYLSSRTDGIYQVNIDAATKTLIGTDEDLVSPAGLFLVENITAGQRETVCGGNELTDAILAIADEGTSSGGLVWTWCLVTDDADVLANNNPSPVARTSPAQIENPRGVAVVNDTMYITGINPDVDDESMAGVLVSAALDALPNEPVDVLTVADTFSEDIKDLTFDTDGTILIADAGQDTIFRYDIDLEELSMITGITGGVRDVLPIGSADDPQYLFTQFANDTVSQSTLLENSELTIVTDGLSLAGPDGIAQ